MSDSRVMVVLTTTANEADASAISRILVEEELAACVQRMPISSTYRWQGRVEESSEYLLVVKTLSDRSEELENRIRELSSYEVPEIVALEATRVATAYEAWLRSACRERGRH